MQEHNQAKLKEELKWLKEQLVATEEERDRAQAELKEARNEVEEANSRSNEAFTSHKIYTELNTVKKLLASTTQELSTKEKEIESLKIDVGRVNGLEHDLREKNTLLNKLKEDLVISKNVGPQNWKKKIHELEVQLSRQKESEVKVFDSLVAVTKQLEQTKISLEESKLEASSLRDKYEESLMLNHGRDCTPRGCFKDNLPMREMLENLSCELQSTKEHLFRAQEGEKAALSKAQSLLSEIGKLRNELKLASDAESNSKKAMDDLALALSEVASESNQAKLQLEVMKVELENSRRELEEMKLKGRSMEDKHKSLLEESRKEADQLMNTAERLRLEAEETLLTWNEKETGFIGCIRQAEEERTLAQQENVRLLESLRAADNMVKAAKDENNKLRDILKQALNEANVAKEAANIAKAENSQLKDCVAAKDDALDFLTREIDNLRANEAAGIENMKELKRMVSGSSTPVERLSVSDDKERILKKQQSMEKEKEKDKDKEKKEEKEKKEDSKDGKRLGKAFSFNLKELRIHSKQKDSDSADEKSKDNDEEREVDEDDQEYADPLKGSIFDVMDSPGSATHHRKKSSCFIGDGEGLTSEDLEQLEASHLHDLENGRFSSRRRRLLRRFGDLLVRRRSYAEPSR